MAVPRAVRTLAISCLVPAYALCPANADAVLRTEATAIVQLKGAGSSLAAPFVTYTAALYAQQHPVRVGYTANGDGAGIAAFQANRVDFALADTPLTAAELARANRNNSGVLQLPILLGAVAITYNLPDLAMSIQLRIDGPTLAAIFLGRIRRWDDPALVHLNPGIELPATPIVPVHLAESSGATYTLSDFLSTVSAPWSRSLGRGKLLRWPMGIETAHSDGVVAATRDHPGAIGYADLYDVVNATLPFMAIRNATGAFISPTRSAVLAAASQFPNVNARHFSIVDAHGARSYPLAGYSWAMIRARHANTAHGAALIQLFRWMSTVAQGYAGFLNYVPLPPAVRQISAHTLDLISVG